MRSVHDVGVAARALAEEEESEATIRGDEGREGPRRVSDSVALFSDRSTENQKRDRAPSNCGQVRSCDEMLRCDDGVGDLRS